jgi:Ca-activated chloride channel family protein
MRRKPCPTYRIRNAAGGAAIDLFAAVGGALLLLTAGCAEKQEPAGVEVLSHATPAPVAPEVAAAPAPPPAAELPTTPPPANAPATGATASKKLGDEKKPADTDDRGRSSGHLMAAQPPPASWQREARTADSLAYAEAEMAEEAGAAPANNLAMAYAPEIHILPTPSSQPNTERYQNLVENPVRIVASDPVSTFSLDVDTGSYSNVRRFLAGGNRPPEDAVRIEELVNYFPYEYPPASGEHPFGVRTELAPCPWKPGHWLMRVAVRADEVNANAMPPVNLVFLVDVSGSMDDAAKLPLLRTSLKLLVPQLRAQDRVSIVVYAGREAVVLEPTPGDQHAKITSAIDALSAGGSTAGEAGIRAAYRLARQAFVKEGINRVLLATDGDFNVGITDFEQLKDLVERERESGVQLSTLGFGTGNLNEHLMEQAADVGNGSYSYVDTLAEARKVLVDQMRSTMVTVARDVKVQVEFNPAVVAEYRLIGYENRVLAREDFNNDRVDAGDVGAGQSVTALYELTPVGAAPSADPLRYGAVAPERKAETPAGPPPSEVAFVKLRYKQPNASVSRLVEMPVHRSAMLASFEAAGDDFRFATAVAGFGQLLRGGTRAGSWTWDDVLREATSSRGKDEFGYRSEFLNLVRMARIGS